VQKRLKNSMSNVSRELPKPYTAPSKPAVFPKNSVKCGFIGCLTILGQYVNINNNNEREV